MTGRQSFVGSAATIATEMNRLVQSDASDGFILVPHITPGGLDEFADQVVPLLQERGVFRTEYEGATLRENLGLTPVPAAGPAREAASEVPAHHLDRACPRSADGRAEIYVRPVR